MNRMIVVVPLFAVLASCATGVEQVHERSFVTHNDEEQEAKERMQYWVGAASKLLDNPGLSGEHKQKLEVAIKQARASLSRYSTLRGRGGIRAAVLAPIRVSAGAIAADDTTGVGLSNDVLLIPLALAAIATYVVTDAAASANELGASWNDALEQMRQLGILTAAAAMTVDELDGVCMSHMVHCLENVWQPAWNREDFGPRKNCKDCYLECKIDGKWPDYKCPRK